MSRPPFSRVAATVALALLAAYVVGAGLAAWLPPDVATFRPVGALFAAAVGAVLGAIASGYRDPTGGSRTSTTTRIVEVGVLVVAARLASIVGLPAGEVAVRWSGWISRPTTLIDLELAVLVGLAVTVWGGVLVTLRDVTALERVAQTAAAHEPLDRLVRRYLLAGLGAAGGVGMAAHTGAPLALPGLAILAYLIGGGLGLARVRLGGLLARWRELGVDVADEVAPRWRRSTVVLVAVAVAIALLLPTPSGIGLIGVIVAIVRGVGLVLEAADALVRRLGTRWAEPFETDWEWEAWDPFPEGELRRPGELIPPGTLPDWLEPVLLVLGVVVLVAVVVYVLRRFGGAGDAGPAARGQVARPPRGRRLREVLGRVVRALRPRAVLAWIVSLWRRAVGGDPRDEIDRTERGAPDRREPRRSRRVGPDDHRERVLAAYADVVRAAELRGVQRRPSRTPYEFEDDLGSLLTGERPALVRLTDRYVEARFSDHVVDEATARRAVAAAERVRRALEVQSDDETERDARDGSERPDGSG